MNLNRTPNPLNREARNQENENWEKIERIIKQISSSINDLVLESGGTSNLEVVQARGGKPVLNERLNEIESNIDDLSSLINDIKDIKSVVVSATEPQDADIWFEVVE